jgi:ABC-type transport system involved in multi-copper enzyme maturation permease subunit
VSFTCEVFWLKRNEGVDEDSKVVFVYFFLLSCLCNLFTFFMAICLSSLWRNHLFLFESGQST